MDQDSKLQQVKDAAVPALDLEHLKRLVWWLKQRIEDLEDKEARE